VCYTNHALDQFLEDLLDIGIQPENLVRLGGKSTARTKPLAIFEQSTTFKHTKASWRVIEGLRFELDHLEERLQNAFARYQSAAVQKEHLMQYLEFPPEDPAFYAALTVPEASDGMTHIGRRGKAVNRFYLLDRWSQGMNAGLFKIVSQRHPVGSGACLFLRGMPSSLAGSWRYSKHELRIFT